MHLSGKKGQEQPSLPRDKVMSMSSKNKPRLYLSSLIFNYIDVLRKLKHLTHKQWFLHMQTLLDSIRLFKNILLL